MLHCIQAIDLVAVLNCDGVIPSLQVSCCMRDITVHVRKGISALQYSDNTSSTLHSNQAIDLVAVLNCDGVIPSLQVSCSCMRDITVHVRKGIGALQYFDTTSSILYCIQVIDLVAVLNCDGVILSLQVSWSCMRDITLHVRKGKMECCCCCALSGVSRCTPGQRPHSFGESKGRKKSSVSFEMPSDRKKKEHVSLDASGPYLIILMIPRLFY